MSRWCFRWRCPHVRAQGRRRRQGPPATPRATAPIDLTGYWVAIISEDWRWRMITPARGDFPSIPMNLAAQKRGRSLGSGQGRSRGRTVQGVWRARPDARADATAYHVAATTTR